MESLFVCCCRSPTDRSVGTQPELDTVHTPEWHCRVSGRWTWPLEPRRWHRGVTFSLMTWHPAVKKGAFLPFPPLASFTYSNLLSLLYGFMQSFWNAMHFSSFFCICRFTDCCLEYIKNQASFPPRIQFAFILCHFIWTNRLCWWIDEAWLFSSKFQKKKSRWFNNKSKEGPTHFIQLTKALEVSFTPCAFSPTRCDALGAGDDIHLMLQQTGRAMWCPGA